MSRDRATLRELWGVVQGHAWTIGRDLHHRVRVPAFTEHRAWTVSVPGMDPSGRVQRVRLSGRWTAGEPGAPAVVVVHGLGGDADSPYCVRLARACHRRGWGCLRVNLRGADLQGEDLYHAGLSSDLAAVLRAPPLCDTSVSFVAGYSLGGHVALRLGLRPPPRLRAVTAVGAPLDLQRSAGAIDRLIALPYRAVVLGSLRRAHAAVAARARIAVPVQQVRSVRTIRDWDRLVVVPRWGFADVTDYWHSQSVGPRLRELKRPSLYIGARFDPMVPVWTVEPSLRNAPALLEWEMLEQGGHVGFPGVIPLFEGRAELEDHILDWFARWI